MNLHRDHLSITRVSDGSLTNSRDSNSMILELVMQFMLPSKWLVLRGSKGRIQHGMGGYKMCLEVHSNGYSDGDIWHSCVYRYTCLILGEFDSRLKLGTK